MSFDVLVQSFPSAFRRLLECASSMAVIVTDKNSVIEECNRAFVGLIGAAQKPLGESFRGYLAKESLDAWDALLEGTAEKSRLAITLRPGSIQTVDCRSIDMGGSVLTVCENAMVTESSAVEKISELQQELVNMTRELTRRNRELEDAQNKIKVLKGMLPICMYCKKIRDDQGYWDQLEAYIDRHSEAEFSHSICPQCMEKYFPEDE
jgi:PAS domain-containing protein